MPVVPAAPTTTPAPAPCPCGCAKCRGTGTIARASKRVGQAALRLLHDRTFDTGAKKLLPVLIFRAVVYAGGGVEAAKVAQHVTPAVLHALGL